jgi:hypothetical protein
LKELLKVHGYLLFDDFSWTFEKSPTLNPQIHPSTANLYSAEQIREPHIALICKAFFDSDSRFELVDLGYEGKELRRAYRRII